MTKSEARKKVNHLTANSEQTPLPVPPALALIAAGRDYVDTEEFARAINKAPQTLRKNRCEQGAAFGVKPIKIGNRLLWSVREIAALLNGEKPAA